MRSIYWSRLQAQRLLFIIGATGLFFLLVAENYAATFLSHYAHSPSQAFLLWVQFGFSTFVALIFLAVGAFVYFYARDRRVAKVLFGFSFTEVVLFATQTGTVAKDPLLTTFAAVSGILTLPLLTTLLLLFPHNYFRQQQDAGGVTRRSNVALRGYIVLLVLLGGIALCYALATSFSLWQVPNWLDALDILYYVVGLGGILVIALSSYLIPWTLRQRQQRRIFVIGAILAFAPIFFLSVLPSSLGWPSLDGQVTATAVILFPLALGYTVVRYQVLVFDTYVRRTVAAAMGVVGLVVLCFFTVVLSNLFLSRVAADVCIVVLLAVLGPCTWWGARVSTERLFFNEFAYYRRLMDNPGLQATEYFNLDKAARLLTVAAMSAFETREVCLYLLDEDTGYFQPYPALKADDPGDEARSSLAQRLLEAVKPGPLEKIAWVSADEPLFGQMARTARPLLLSEAGKGGSLPSGLARYLATTGALDSAEPLLAPVRAQGKMIGMLVLGERGDHQQYAGPDFEAIHLIISRFSSVVETARVYERVSHHVAILNSLYGTTVMLVEAFGTLEEAAEAYTKVAAEAVTAGSEMWLYDEQERLLRCVALAGSGPRLTKQDMLTPAEESDWSPYFYRGERGPASDVPACIKSVPDFPFAWIPLQRGQHHLGILALTYPRPHLFSHEEKRVLEMFANQSAVALENTKITLELRAAYERQKELDRLKDQFIITASHELRTPLTAVQGYIELLAAYNGTLDPRTRAGFIAKASRSCDELTLLVGNIMDASRVHIDAKNIKLDAVSLAKSVQHVLEITEAMTVRELREVSVDISADVWVMADDLRLRQVLLNLVGNALKYSPVGSPLEITSDGGSEEVTVRIRDHGLGVPKSEQEHLFERFVRLERDMNSPVRGAGLGLYISKQLVEAMGGRIWVESTGVEGEGSTFAFILSYARLEKKDAYLKSQQV